jgi:hypothetical protein
VDDLALAKAVRVAAQDVLGAEDVVEALALDGLNEVLDRDRVVEVARG